jgi:hypothetical protein
VAKRELATGILLQLITVADTSDPLSDGGPPPPRIGRLHTLVRGWGIFNRLYGDFYTGADKGYHCASAVNGIKMSKRTVLPPGGATCVNGGNITGSAQVCADATPADITTHKAAMVSRI